MNILVTAPYSSEALQQLERYGTVHFRPWKPHGRAFHSDELIRLIQETGADCLITEHDHVDASVIETVDLKFIGVCRGTPSNVDIAKATSRGIPVFNTPARNAQAVAELVTAGLIVFLRKMREGEAWLKSGQWKGDAHESYLYFRGHEICGKTVGMVGFGGVGQRVAAVLSGFSCKIQYYDPYLKQSPNPEYVPITLEEIFSTSDIVSIHLPVTAETTGSINERLFRMMKPEAIFVNSARAAVVDRDALYNTLKEQRIGGAILDVFYNEPPDASDYELISLPNVYATPHIAGASFEVDGYSVTIMNDVLKEWFVHGNREIRQLVNPSVLSSLESHRTAL
ncbi:NAD(P)-dependent oxidoreductase [Paenibacillus allorhizosphaerae]|uniref:2-hydroxyacid dehydrogenase YoaD n=1 Tax=Paenibacillus allorhizosphaerae TaxID=2849866 RepID=A0ABM8VQT8_9BACL|nr:NAD(P)-dependent oxidoreductase [Paenibacillus allorhizosphaerae]CAG7654637.1 Putative 2-hydroxyacid dehydrogenase YoaD [Paenibacillus allorhizosphaerae]